MPHLQLEVSRDIADATNISEILKELVARFSEIETIDPRAVKAYVRIAEIWLTGDPERPSFVHLTICVLDGRAPSLLSQISDSLHQSLCNSFFQVLEKIPALVTLELRQMNRQDYRK